MKEYTIYIKEAESCNHYKDFDINEVMKEFADNGFNVTEEAIMHNFEAWQDDFKSGFKDEKNGYFLFTPCGCNALRFEACKLTGVDWQVTYEA